MPTTKRFIHVKRAAKSTLAGIGAIGTGALEELGNLRSYIARMAVLVPGRHTYDLNDPACRVAMANAIWRPDEYLTALHNNMSFSNPALSALLMTATGNRTSEQQRNNAAYNYKRLGMLEGILSVVARMRSIFYMPFLTLLLAVLCVITHVPVLFQDVLHVFYRGILPGQEWTEAFIDEALAHNPGPTYEVLPGVGAAMLDNLSVQVGYTRVRIRRDHFTAVSGWPHTHTHTHARTDARMDARAHARGRTHASCGYARQPVRAGRLPWHFLHGRPWSFTAHDAVAEDGRAESGGGRRF